MWSIDKLFIDGYKVTKGKLKTHKNNLQQF